MDSRIKIHCECGKSGLVERKHIGKTITCPKCGISRIKVEDPEADTIAIPHELPNAIPVLPTSVPPVSMRSSALRMHLSKGLLKRIDGTFIYRTIVVFTLVYCCFSLARIEYRHNKREQIYQALKKLDGWADEVMSNIAKAKNSGEFEKLDAEVDVAREWKKQLEILLEEKKAELKRLERQ